MQHEISTDYWNPAIRPGKADMLGSLRIDSDATSLESVGRCTAHGAGSLAVDKPLRADRGGLLELASSKRRRRRDERGSDGDRQQARLQLHDFSPCDVWICPDGGASDTSLCIGE